MLVQPKSRLKRGLIGGAVGVAALAAAAPAVAAPTGIYADFRYCPTGNPSVTQCLVSDTTSGNIKLGNQNVPVNRLIRLQGGLAQNVSTGGTTFVLANPSSRTLEAPPLDVPGGLTGLTPPSMFPLPVIGFVLAAISNANAVTAQAELVGTPSVDVNNIAAGEGVGVSLPLRIKLNNPFLGNNCYIGSSAAPVRFNLTTGTTSPPAGTAPLTGNGGEISNVGPGVNIIQPVSLVDNTFPVPAASGCGPIGGPISNAIVTGVVNAKVGLPAARGRSSAVLNGSVRIARPSNVVASGQ